MSDIEEEEARTRAQLNLVIESHLSKLNQEQQEIYDKIKSRRTPKRIQLTRYCNSLKTFLQAHKGERISKDQLELHRVKLDNVLKELKQVDDEIWQFWSLHCSANTEEEIINAEMTVGACWTEMAEQILLDCRRLQHHLTTPSTPAVPSTPAAPVVPPAPIIPAAQSLQVKLPKIDLPKFYGESPVEYQTFINQFNSR